MTVLRRDLFGLYGIAEPAAAPDVTVRTLSALLGQPGVAPRSRVGRAPTRRSGVSAGALLLREGYPGLSDSEMGPRHYRSDPARHCPDCADGSTAPVEVPVDGSEPEDGQDDNLLEAVSARRPGQPRLRMASATGAVLAVGSLAFVSAVGGNVIPGPGPVAVAVRDIGNAMSDHPSRHVSATPLAWGAIEGGAGRARTLAKDARAVSGDRAGSPHVSGPDSRAEDTHPAAGSGGDQVAQRSVSPAGGVDAGRTADRVGPIGGALSGTRSNDGSAERRTEGAGGPSAGGTGASAASSPAGRVGGPVRNLGEGGSPSVTGSTGNHPSAGSAAGRGSAGDSHSSTLAASRKADSASGKAPATTRSGSVRTHSSASAGGGSSRSSENRAGHLGGGKSGSGESGSGHSGGGKSGSSKSGSGHSSSGHSSGGHSGGGHSGGGHSGH